VLPILDRLTASLADRYRLERELGAGGMATVYLAHDLRHHRPVAVKVLRPELAAIIGAERFLAEIRTTANLQHPHILPLFDSGESDGFLFYVMPFVQGESLRDRLRRETQLPIGEAVRIATEVGSALDYAHRHGVIHRDIKPENILIHDGRALVADFGIALALSSAGTGTGSGGRMTETGMSLGTPHYMSPEQAMGEREITGRSDIYALGAVLYEMLVGEPPFTGPSVQAIVAKVLTEEPRPLVPKRHTIPPHLEAVVLTALEKLPADRYATAAEFIAALSDTTARRAGTTVAMPAAARYGGRARMLVPALGAAVLLLGLLAAWLALRPTPAGVVQRYGLALPESEAVQGPFAISPDGQNLVYLGPAGTAGQLWLKAHDRSDAVPLPGTSADQVAIAFSPDGQSIAFVDNGRQVRKISLAGGAAVVLADSASPVGLAWLDDGSIVYVEFGTRSLRRVPAVGGPSEMLLKGDSTPAILPRALPGSRALLFTLCQGGSCAIRQGLWTLDLRSRKARPLIAGAVSGDYVDTGHLLYVRHDGAMFAVPFDPRKAVIRGQPVPVLDSISTLNGIFPLYSVSRTGTMVVRPGTTSGGPTYEMVWVDRAGRETQVDPSWKFRMVVYGANIGWSLSPDGSRVAIGLNTDAGDDIWVKRLPAGELSRVSFDSASDFRPRWMPDGRSLSFISTRGGPMGGANGARLFRRPADGTGRDSLLLRVGQPVYEAEWSRDGKWLVLRMGGTINQVGNRDISAMRPGLDSAPVPILASQQFDESAAALSPDGRWIAYQSNEAGQQDVYLRPFPGVDAGKRQVSTSGGVAPVWAPNGRELFYVNRTRDMMVVTVGPGPELTISDPKVLFHLGDRLYMTQAENYTPFDISPDGQRFLMARRVVDASAAPVPLVVTENWFQELKARMKR
jgi:serine/threonine-protein kinase